MGHLNVRFYVARAMEGLVGLAGALGLPGAFKDQATATLLLTDHHIRFIREARSRAPLHMVAGVLDMDDTRARFLQLLIHSLTGEIAASFQTLVVHATAREGRAFPWSERTRALADRLRMDVPERAAPRSLGLTPPSGGASLSEAERLDLIRLGAGSVGSTDCDVFGRMRPDVFIGRVSDGIPALGVALRAGMADGPSTRPHGVGGAVLEYRVAYHAWPRAGDRFEIRSGLAEVGDRTQRLAHWMLDPETGRAWVSAEAVAIALDLGERKVIPIGPAERAHLLTRVTPGLSL
jgi:acyl-CoA thioester hydrolase